MSKMLTYVGIFFILIFAWYGVKKLIFMWFMSHYQPPAVTVSAAKVNNKTWQPYLTAVGTLTAINGVDLSAETAGTVREIRFNSGQYVRQGDVLILLDSSVEQAQLKDNEARLKLAQLSYEREKSLFDKHVTSQATLDTRYAELQEAEAGVASVEARIKQKTITAPFSGRVGIRQINLGQYISPGTPMVTLQAIDSLYVMVSLPEQYLPNLYIEQPVSITVNFGEGKTVSGKITAINSKVDPLTRNILIQATIPNEQFALYPGMYALAKIWLKTQKDMIVIPQTAVSYSLSGDYVFLVKKEKKKYQVVRQFVKIGERRENEVSVLSGLKPGDEIVTSGQLKLQNGTEIKIDNSVEL